MLASCPANCLSLTHRFLQRPLFFTRILIRPHALGRASVLDDQLVAMTAELADAHKAFTQAQSRESDLKQIVSELELALQTDREERRQLEQVKIDQLQRLEDVQVELTQVKRAQDSLQTALTTATAERDAAQGTISGLQRALDQAEQHGSTVQAVLAETQTERDALRESLDQWKERHASVEKERVLAQAAAEQANKERDALVAEQSRLEEIQAGLTILLNAIDKEA